MLSATWSGISLASELRTFLIDFNVPPTARWLLRRQLHLHTYDIDPVFSCQTEQPACVLAADLFPIELADLTMIKPVGRLLEIFEWVVYGVQDAVAADLQHGREQ